ncbi:MAG: dockerin type I repeat-containing protein, partial [Chloroflexi bacterium]|nr:dockerin type I repeat-containing protein [Chloroflexota bacterium]
SLSLTCTFADQSDFAGDLLSFTLTCPENTGDTVLEFDGASFIGAEPDLGPPTLIGAQATCLDAAFVEPPRLLGDADCSEAVTSIDAAFILQFVARLLESLACQTAGDTNEDGVIDSIDAVLILQNVAGLL